MNLKGVYSSFAVSRAAPRPSKIGIYGPHNILEIVRILVTGGAGFIGGNLVNRLASMGAGNVLVLDNLHRGFSRDLLPTTIEFRTADIRDSAALAHAFKGREIVFHLAAQSNV